MGGNGNGSYGAVHSSPRSRQDAVIKHAERAWQSEFQLRYLPVAAVATGAVTYTVCRVMAHVYGTYLGGIPWPFFSDTGRDKPAYYIFVAGGALECVLALASLWCVFHRFKNWLHEIRGLDLIPVGRSLDVLSTVGCAFGAAAQPLLLVVSVFDTSHYPGVHQTAADTFFCLSTVSLLCLMTYMRIISGLYPNNAHLRLSARVKAVVFVTWVLGFIVYIPLGIAISCPARLLGIRECIDIEHLSPEYCEGNYNPRHQGYTIFWTYKDCPRMFTLRTLGQFVCLFSLLSFNASFAFDLRPALMWVNPDDNTPPPPSSRHAFLTSVA